MSPEFMRRWSLVAVVAATAAVAACGGGSGYSGTQPPPPPPTGNPPPPPPPGSSRGDIVKAKVLGQLSIQDINGQSNFAPSLVNDTPTCPVTVVSLQYTTIDPSGALATAGMGLLYPDESCHALPSGHPLLSHQHGTSVDKTFDTADTNQSHIAAGLAAMFASHGYVVAMPNYLGYAGSSIDWHSYLVAAPSGAVVVDGIRAARNWLGANAKSTHLSGDVYLSGTSQGGYVTLATQWVIESDPDLAAEFNLKAVAPTSGPYDLAGRFNYDMTTPDDPNNSESAVAAFSMYAMQRTYGDIYSDPTQLFNAPWAKNFDVSAPVVMPGPYSTEAQLIKNCILPFNLKDPGGPDNAGCDNGQKIPLLTAAFVDQYLNDTPNTPGSVAKKHAQDNTLVVAGPTSAQKWTPVAPITFCWGSIDTIVGPSATEGANLAGAHTVDVQTDTSEPSYILQFMQANAGADQYHGSVEAPGCTSYAKNVLFPRPY